MWGAFVTGFAEGATELIKEENKSISNRVLAEMETALKKRARAEETAQTKRDEYRQQAQALKTLSGDRLTETQIIGILSGGEADTVISQLRKRQVGPEKLAKLFVPAAPEDQAQLEEYLSEVGKLTGTVPTRVGEDTTAFGLPTRVGERKRKELLAKTGMTEEELYQTQMATPTGVAGTLDLSIFEDEASIKEMEDSLVKTIIDPESTREDKSVATQKLAELRATKRIGVRGEDSDVKASDVRADLRNLDNTIKRSIAGPGDLVVFTNPETGQQSLELSNDIDPKVRQQIESRRREAFQAYVDQYYGQTGSIPLTVRRVMGAFLGPAQAAEPTPAPAPAAGLITVTDPTGKVHRFKTQKEADAFKKAAGIK